VLGDDAGDDGLGDALTAIVEVEGRGAPEGAPPGGEDLGAGAFPDGEERDDAAQDLVGEKADQIGASRFSSAPRRRLFAVGLLRLHPLRLSAGDDAHGGIRLLGATFFSSD
jgi:hypothetical protein